MNNIKILKAQAKLALTEVEPRLELAIVNYITALEKQIEKLEKQIELDVNYEMWLRKR
jgi:hypothetical protein